MLKRILLLTTITLLTFSCDYISDPIADGNSGGGDTTEVYRNVLIEEFTGHQCVNCPEGAEEIHRIQGMPVFEGKVYTIAVHAGYFANTSPDYPKDYTTPEGDQMQSIYAPFAYPTAMVNRYDYSTGSTEHLKSMGAWETVAAEVISEKSIVDIIPSVSFNTTNRQAAISVDLKWLSNVSGQNYHIVAMLTEDGIIGPQLTHGGKVNDYEFVHMLRGSSNGLIGEAVGSADIVAGDEETYSSSITLDASWVAEKCHIVVYIYDVATHEIMHVESASVL